MSVKALVFGLASLLASRLTELAQQVPVYIVVVFWANLLMLDKLGSPQSSLPCMQVNSFKTWKDIKSQFSKQGRQSS